MPANLYRLLAAGGLPRGHAGAAWAVLGPDVTLRRTAYDTGAAAAMLSATASGLPGIEDFIGNVTRSTSDAEALPVFTDAARQQVRQRAR